MKSEINRAANPGTKNSCGIVLPQERNYFAVMMLDHAP